MFKIVEKHVEDGVVEIDSEYFLPPIYIKDGRYWFDVHYGIYGVISVVMISNGTYWEKDLRERCGLGAIET